MNTIITPQDARSLLKECGSALQVLNPDLHARLVLATQQDSDRTREIRRMAVDDFQDEGDLEFDEDATVNETEENGAWVAAWRWVPFELTQFDKVDRTSPDRPMDEMSIDDIEERP